MKIKENLKNFKYVIGYALEKMKGIIIYNVIYAIILGVLPICTLHITKNIMNILDNNITDKKNILCLAASLLITINLIIKIFTYINSYFENINVLIFAQKFEVTIFEKLQDMQVSFWEDTKFNDLFHKVYLGANSNFSIILSDFFMMIQNCITMYTYIYSLKNINIDMWKKLLIILSGLLAFIYRRYFFNKQDELTVESDDIIAPIHRKEKIFSEIFSNPIVQDELRTYNAQDFFINKIKSLNRDIFIINKKAKYKIHNYNRIGAMGVYFIQRIIYIIFLYDIFKKQMNYGEFVLVIGVLEGIFAAGVQLNLKFSIIWENLYYVKFLREFLDIEGESKNKSKGLLELKHEIETIEFVNVSFRYPNTKDYILRNVSFKINKGEKIGIIGNNGSGKTTVLKIIMKLYSVDKGEVLINGININRIKSSSLYSQLGVVFQDFCKYSLSLKEFLLLGNIQFNKGLDELDRILKMLQIDKLVKTLPDGIDTFLTKELDEKSVDLSEGEWQKLTIARALFSNKSFIILDEPTSFLDTFSEKKIFEFIYEEMKDTTMFFISHNLSNVKQCDKIIMMSNGEIIGCGKHEKLIVEHKYYKYLYNSQAKRFIEEEN